MDHVQAEEMGLTCPQTLWGEGPIPVLYCCKFYVCLVHPIAEKNHLSNQMQPSEHVLGPCSDGGRTFHCGIE